MTDEERKTEEEKAGNGMKLIRQTGTCRYCHQSRFIDAPEGADQDFLDDLATKECNCPEALEAERRTTRMEAAKAWAANVFDQCECRKELFTAAIEAVFTTAADSVTVKTGKNTYKIGISGEGLLTIEKKFQETDREEF